MFRDDGGRAGLVAILCDDSVKRERARLVYAPLKIR